MKRSIYIIYILILSLLLSACNIKFALNRPKFVDESFYDMWDNAFTFNSQKFDDCEFEYYISEAGTSSVNTRIFIYRYDDYLIFSIAYFSGGDGFMETFPLNEDQGEKFLELVENSTVDDEASYAQPGVGSYYCEYTLKNATLPKSVQPLDLKQLSLQLTEARDFSNNDYYHIFDFSDKEFNKFGKCYNKYISHSTSDVYFSIVSQIEKYIDKQLVSAEVLELNSEDAILKLEFLNDETVTITTTYGGCIVNIEK